MKQKLFLFIAAVFFCLTAGAQETLYKSTSLIGIWNQLQPYPIDSVRMAWIPTGNFKIYNVDRPKPYTFTPIRKSSTAVIPNQRFAIKCKTIPSCK